jgi:hypothetical protein
MTYYADPLQASIALDASYRALMLALDQKVDLGALAAPQGAL